MTTFASCGGTRSTACPSRFGFRSSARHGSLSANAVREEVQLLNHQYTRVIALIGILGLLVVAPAAAQTTDSKSLDEVNKELSNPISSIWALQLQENTYWLNRPDRAARSPSSYKLSTMWPGWARPAA